MLNLSATIQSIMASAMGKPIEIHDIYLGSQTAEDSDTLHFVNYYKNISFFQYISGDAQVYTPLGVGRAAVKKNSSAEVDSIAYRLDNVNKAMGSYAATKNFRNKRFVTRLLFRDALDSADDTKIIFDGYIQSIVFKKSSMEAYCVPIISSLAFETGWPYQLNCNAKFGDSFCQINKESIDNKVSGTATGGTTTTVIDTNNLILKADDYWNHGTIEFTSGDNNRLKRKIVDFDLATNTLSLDYAVAVAVVSGDTYIVRRGCDKTLTTCQNTYNNDINYHGFNAIPLTNT